MGCRRNGWVRSGVEHLEVYWRRCSEGRLATNWTVAAERGCMQLGWETDEGNVEVVMVMKMMMVVVQRDGNGGYDEGWGDGANLELLPSTLCVQTDI